MMRKFVTGAVLLLAIFVTTGALHAQAVVPFTFDAGYGSTAGSPDGCKDILSEGSSVFTPNAYGQTGYLMCFDGGAYGYGPGFAIELENVDGPALPNNGYMAEGNPLSYGQKIWGTRADGATMNGSQVGDTFVWPATTTIPVENTEGGTTNVAVTLMLNFTYVPGQKRVCVYRTCHYVPGSPVAQFQGGSGTLQF